MEETPIPRSGQSVPAQVRECYELAAAWADSPEVRQRMEEKIAGIGGIISNPSIQPLPETAQGRASAVVQMLAGSARNAAVIQTMAAAVPDSAERAYLMALAALCSGRNDRIQAVRQVTAALAREPGDPRYIALAEILREAEVST